MLAALQSLGKSSTDVAAKRVITSQGLVGALDDDNVLLTAQRIDDRRLRERADDVDVNGADLRIALLAQVITGALNIFRRATKRHKHRVSILRAVFLNQPVAAAGELSKFLVALFEHPEDGFAEIIAACDAAVHMVLLILDGAEQDGVFKVHHLRHTTTRGAKEFALGRGRAVDGVIGRAQVLAQQIRFRRAVGALGMGSEHSVLDVHPRVQCQLVALTQDDRLISCLLSVSPHQHCPAGIQSSIKIIVPTVDVERVLG